MKSLVEMELVRATEENRHRLPRNRRRRFENAITDGVVIRRAASQDGARLERLAQLDSRHVPAAPALVAELDGVLVAAVSLNGGGAVADPFMRSAPLVELLELRAAQLRTAA